jgi:hypothetical protein
MAEVYHRDSWHPLSPCQGDDVLPRHSCEPTVQVRALKLHIHTDPVRDGRNVVENCELKRRTQEAAIHFIAKRRRAVLCGCREHQGNLKHRPHASRNRFDRGGWIRAGEC